MSIRRVTTPYKFKVTRGVAADSPAASTKGLLQLIRFDPSTNTQGIQSFEYSKKQDFMVLDLLTAVKAHQDPSLTFRASCCEGVCGSCAMNINGVNSLACVTYASQHTIVGPLPNFPVLKDFVVDLRGFFKQYEFIRPFVRNVNLHRYHISSILERYRQTCRVIFNEDTRSPDGTLAIDSKTLTNVAPELDAYLGILDKLVNVGDVAKAVEVLEKIENLGYLLNDDNVKSLLKKALANHKKA
eukprot:Tbor_TRINITY_DN1738_c0_g1::TRINITY_DN1738_c0_g1_i1::g.21311::m.21311/K00235/SDHB, SDH2; succinate dehydrogenase (ubiquinone) iron-sulfur subunit